MSHIAIFEVPTYHKLLCITDAGINIAPGLKKKVHILRNAVAAYHKLGVAKPKVACICAVEKINPKMKCTLDAAKLAAMSRDGRIEGAIIEGPYALDNAIDAEAAKIKGIKGEVVGDADILLCPEIATANVLYKSLAYLGKCNGAAIVAGTSAPVILTSRADAERVKFSSISLAIAIS